MNDWTPLGNAESPAGLAMPVLQVNPREAMRILVIGTIFTNEGVQSDALSPFAHGYFKNYVRLVAKAIREYESARSNLIVYIETSHENMGAVIDLMVAGDHLETCFNSMHRALRLLNLLKAAPTAPVTKRDTRVFDEQTIMGFRHAAEHVVEFLGDGRIPPDGDVMIRPFLEGVAFASRRVAYQTLARWLERMNELSLRLVQFDPLKDQRAVSQLAEDLEKDTLVEDE